MSDDRIAKLEAWRDSHDREHDALERRIEDRTKTALSDAFDGMKRHVAETGIATKREIEAQGKQIADLRVETSAQTATLGEQNTKLDKLVTNADDNAIERGRRKERDEQEAKLERKADRRLREWKARQPIIRVAIGATVAIATAVITHGCHIF